MDFKFVRVDFGASKKLIKTRQEGKCEEKVSHPPALVKRNAGAPTESVRLV